jgi:AbrB family looped-hinge helix DNA binding protein
MMASLSSKGQLTLPIEVRRALHLTAGDRLDVVLGENNRVELIPLSRSIRDLKGMLPKPAKSVSLEDMDRAIQVASE